MDDEIAKAFSLKTREFLENQTPAEIALRATVERRKAELGKAMEKEKTENIQPLLDALKLVGKCRRSKGGGVCDPCWSAVTKELDALGLHIWGF